MSRIWEWGLPAVAGLLLAAGLLWESAVQPPVASTVALTQRALHRDTTGDRLASDGWFWRLIEHAPSGIATLTAAGLLAVWIRGAAAGESAMNFERSSWLRET